MLLGVLSEAGRVENVFELPEYREFLEDMKQWYDAGYVYPDGAFTDSYLEELVLRAGAYLSRQQQTGIWGGDNLWGRSGGAPYQ